MQIVWSVFLIVVFFSSAVFIHEFGHFLVARWCGMKVKTFSIGFGPAMWKKTVNGIEYRISWLPLGGYVSLPQMDPSGEALKTDEKQDPLPAARPFPKILVALAGVTGNMILAFAFACLVYWFGKPAQPFEVNTVIGFVSTNEVIHASGLLPGDTIVSVNGRSVRNWTELRYEGSLDTQAELVVRSGAAERTVILPVTTNDLGMYGIEGIAPMSYSAVLDVSKDMPAERAGIKAGDVIREIDGRRLYSWEQFVSTVSSNRGTQIALTVERNGRRMSIPLTPQYDAQTNRAFAGIRWNPEYAEASLVAHPTPATQIAEHGGMIFRVLKDLVTPKKAARAAGGMGGPISIFWVLWLKIQNGLMAAISFAVFFNVNLAILNLLPLPVLDGGHIMVSLYEAVFRRPANKKVVLALWNATAILLLSLMLLLTFKDFRLIQRVNSLDKATPAAATAPGAATNAPAKP